MCRLLRVFTVLVVTGFITNTFGQGFSNYNWYFGDQGQGIHFSKNQTMTGFVSTAKLKMGGTAVAADPSTGTVLFYTDGQEVYDVTNKKMTNGPLPGNTASNQGVAVCRMPGVGNENKYFIFTNTASGNIPGAIQYTIIDMSKTGNALFPEPPLGEIDITKKNQATGIINACEAMLVVPNATRDGFWLITHQNGANNYIVGGISNIGAITAPVARYGGGDITQASHIAYFDNRSNATPAVHRIAVTSQLNDENVEILDFDPASGALTNPVTIANSGNAGPVYDTEWGYSGNILYISRTGDAANVADVFQCNLKNTPPRMTSVLKAPINRSYGLHLAPDSAIYHLYQTTARGDFLLAKITKVDKLTTNPLFGYSNNLFTGRSIGARQFPVFLPPYREAYVLSFKPDKGCLNSAITFHPKLTAGSKNITIDAASWDFNGDGKTNSNTIIPVFTYTDNSNLTPTVRLTVRSGGISYTTTQKVNLTDFQLQISMTSDTTFCKEEFPPPRGTGVRGGPSITAKISGGTPTSINWFGPGGNTGQTGNILRPDSSGYYHIVATQGSCSAYQGVNVREYGLQEQRSNIWYFGKNAGIDFNKNPPVALNDSKMSAPEGCAAVSDRNGRIILYTDGVNVYDKKHTQITTGDLGGDQAATQSALIVPFVKDETRYYIFTTKNIYNPSHTYELSYSVFDLKLKNGLGDIVEKNTLLLSPNTERITATANWLIAHEYGNNTFRTYPISTNGIGNPVYSNPGLIHAKNSSESAQGYMKLSSRNLLAVAVGNQVELLKFNTTTGVLSDTLTLKLKTPGNAYGIEFSPDGSKLFASVHDRSSSKILRWEVDSTTVSGNSTHRDHITKSRNEVASVGELLGAIQTGPNGVVYVARKDVRSLATITNPGAQMYDKKIKKFTFSNPDFKLAGFPLTAGTESKLGLPNFIQNLSSAAKSPSMSVANACSGNPLNFTVSGTSVIDKYRWNILNSSNALVQTSTAKNPAFTINTAGKYTASVFIYNRCAASPNLNLTRPFEIFAIPAFNFKHIKKPKTCGVADGSFTINVTSSESFSYAVSGPANSFGKNITGPRQITIVGLVAGAYRVTLTDDTNGCRLTQVVTISDPVGYTLSGAGLTDCAGKNGVVTINFTGSPIPGRITYVLTNETSNTIVPGHNNRTIAVTGNSFQIKGIIQGTYTLQITDGGCKFLLSGIAVAPPPPYNLTIPADLTACDATSVNLNITTNAPEIRITDPAKNVSSLNLAGATTTTVTFNSEGLHQITALNPTNPVNPSTCPVTRPITITFNSATASPLKSQYIICPDDPDPAVTTTTLKAGTRFITVRWFDENNNLLQNGNGYTFSGDYIVVRMPGTIIAELTNPFGCITRDNISIVKDCQPRIVAPNAFYPASSVAKNKNFSIFSLFLKPDQFEVYIYNRWGELVFQSVDVNFQWNGGHDNSVSKPLPLGTYAYIVKYVDKNNVEKGVQEKRGGVLLIR